MLFLCRLRRYPFSDFPFDFPWQGHENFPHGIEILTAADYFTLGVRSNAYLKIAIFVASFDKYRMGLVSHV